MVLGQYVEVLGGTRSIWGSRGWYWIRIWQLWLVLGGTRSLLGSSGWYMVVTGQYGALMVGS